MKSIFAWILGAALIFGTILYVEAEHPTSLITQSNYISQPSENDEVNCCFWVAGWFDGLPGVPGPQITILDNRGYEIEINPPGYDEWVWWSGRLFARVCIEDGNAGDVYTVSVYNPANGKTDSVKVILRTDCPEPEEDEIAKKLKHSVAPPLAD